MGLTLSTKSRYGARAMLDLALNDHDRAVSLKDIAGRQGISEKYLENIMRTLVTSGFVRSERGKHGGFKLARPPERITLGGIIRQVEGSMSLVPCVDDPNLCERSSVCVTIDIWKKASAALIEVFGSVTLKDMVLMHRKKTDMTDGFVL